MKLFLSTLRSQLFALFGLVAAFLLLAAPDCLRAQSQSTFGTFANFFGSGLFANATSSNNWSGAGVFGGLSGATITTNAVPLRNSPLGIGLTISFNAYTNGTPTNTQFFFALSGDGTNFSRSDVGMIQVSTYSATALGAGATNGYTIFTNVPQAALGNARAIRLERLVNNSAGGISNIVARYSYFY